jgi:hypothetical protein
MDECPICLEPLAGTVVHLGCCKKQVHIQCYVSRCPLCRTELPLPVHTVPAPSHVIIPVPVQVPPNRWRFIMRLLISSAISAGLAVFILKN